MYKSFKFDPYKALKSILEVTSAHIGKDFIKVTADEIKKLFQADLVFITKALNYNPTTKVKILYATDDVMPPVFELDGTPCKLVFKNKIVKINECLQHDFEKEKGTGFESFYGIPINNDDNICIGHIAILSKQKRELPDELEDIALIYSRKIQTETKRLELEQENEKIRKELERLSITDSLTNLYNRRHFDNFADDTLKQIKRFDTNASLALLDIDDFKKLNDTYGHKVGDEVLIYLSKTLIDNSRDGIDYIFRIGGEEFAIISLNSTINSSISHLQRINNQLKKFPFDENISLTITVGIDSFKKDDKDFDDLYLRVDNKLYEGKEKGKNRIIH